MDRRLSIIRTAIATLAGLLVVRAAFVEPFGVTSGSMLPGIAGHHCAAKCPDCGLVWRASAPADAASLRHLRRARCPNCGCEHLGLDAATDVPGDRLLVDKIGPDLFPLQRYDLAIFRTAHDPSRPYLKRIVGLPGEAIRLTDGDAFADGTLLRKTRDECHRVSIPVYDHAHPPPAGWASRWLELFGTADPTPANVADDSLSVAGRNDSSYRWLVYRHWQRDSQREEPVLDGMTLLTGGSASQPPEVHDFRVECDVETAGEGVFAVALNDGRDRAFALLPCPPTAEGVRVLIGDGQVRGVPFTGLTPGKKHRIEMLFIDRRVCVALDGDEIIGAIDLPPVPARGGVSRPLRFGAKGIDARVTDLRLFHDVHYTATSDREYRLGPDEYFLLGDCSPLSDDSRTWPQPGVPQSAIIGRPRWRHQAGAWLDFARLGPVR